MTAAPPLTGTGDTTGQVGNAGAAPTGTAQFATGETDTTVGGAAGSATAAATPPKVTGTLDTDPIYGTNQPSAYTPTSTLVTGTFNTHGGGAANSTQQVYRAPAVIGLVAATKDTTNSPGFTAAVPPDRFPWVAQTTETYNFGAPSGVVGPATDTGLIDQTTPLAVTKTGVIGAAGTITVVNNGTTTAVAAEAHTIDQTTLFTLTHAGVTTAAASLALTNNGQIIAVTAEAGHNIDIATPFTLTHAGVTTAAASLVVKNGATTLTYNTDYTVTPTGAGATANYTILRLNTGATTNGTAVTVGYSYGNAAHFTPVPLVNVTDYAVTATGSGVTANYTILRNSASTACANGDSVAVAYSYGNAAHFTPVTLVLTTDYTVTFTAQWAQRTFTILRNSASSTAANGDSVAVTYTYGDSVYWGTHDPASPPPAPTIGTCIPADRAVQVVWTTPGLAATDDIDGFIIMSDTGGTRYVPGGNLTYMFRQVTPGVPVTFAVAAFNDAGTGAYSAFSVAVTPLNYDEVPTGTLDPRNTVNPIYSIDGSIVAGSNLGAGSVIPG